MKQLTVICLLAVTLILSGCGGGVAPVAPTTAPKAETTG